MKARLEGRIVNCLRCGGPAKVSPRDQSAAPCWICEECFAHEHASRRCTDAGYRRRADARAKASGRMYWEAVEG